MRRYLFIVWLFIASGALAQPSQGQYFTSFDGTRIYYEMSGKGMPVLLLHGFGNTSANWLETATYTTLLKAGYRVIVPDMRGNGRSDTSVNEQGYANDAQVRDLIALMASLHIQKYDMVGYSRGAIVGAKLLKMDQQHISKAILGGMGDAFTNPNWDVPQRFYRAFMGDTTVRDYQALQGTIKYADQIHLSRRALAYQQKYQPVTTAQQLGQVHVPVMILRGTDDWGNGSAEMLQSFIPGARLKYVPGDHNHAYSTQDFADAVLEFFNEL